MLTNQINSGGSNIHPSDIIALQNFLDTFKGPWWIDDGWSLFHQEPLVHVQKGQS